MAALILSGALAVFLVVFMIMSEIHEQKKFARQVEKSFGKKPSDSFDPEEAQGVYVGKQNANPERRVLDDLTWQDLDMDGIYAQVNACFTSVGDGCLYDLMRRAEPDIGGAERREDLLGALAHNPGLCSQLRILLARVGRSGGDMFPLLYEGEIEGLRFIWPIRILSVVWIGAFPLFFVDIGLALAVLLVLFVVDVLIHSVVTRQISLELEALRYLASVLWGCKKLCKIQAPELGDLQSRLSPLAKCFNRLSRKVGVVFRNRMLVSLFSEYYGILTMAELRGYHAAAKLLKAKRADLQELCECLGELDLTLAILSYRKYLGNFCQPTFHNKPEILFAGLVHPLLDDPVPNTGEIVKNSLITGLNASGKTTFMKAVAVNCILAQTINTCTARSFTLCPSQVVTAMAMVDDLLQGDSYYVAEIKALKRIIDLSRLGPTICFIDEILRGTNRTERTAISSSFLRYLNSLNTRCLVATHDREIAETLDGPYENFYFSEEIIEGKPVFDYLLKKGISSGGNAIRLLEQMGFPQRIVAQANAWIENSV